MERKVTKGPFEIISCHILSFGEKSEKFWKIIKLVPGVSNFGRFGPWWDNFERKIILGPWEVTKIIFSPWCEVCGNYMFGPSSLATCQNWSPGI